MLPGGARATTPAGGGSGLGIGGGGSDGSLYDRLGGREGVQSLMSASIDSLHGHAQLNRQNPRLAAASRTTNPAELKKHVTNFICQHAGGPGLYDGRSMAAAHAQLGITEADWSLFMDDTSKLLRERGVPGPDQRDLLALMDSTKADIVS
jgi:hemoglobin